MLNKRHNMNNICIKKAKILDINKSDAYFDSKNRFIGKYIYTNFKNKYICKKDNKRYYRGDFKVIEKSGLVYHFFDSIKLEFKEKNCANCEDKLKCITGELDF